MDLVQTAQAPIVVNFDTVTLAIPRMTIKDWSLFSSMLNKAKTELVTEGMDEDARRHWLNFYAPLPIGMVDLERAVGTAEGVEFVIKHCVSKAKITHRKNKEGVLELETPSASPSEKEKEKSSKELKKIAKVIIEAVPKARLYDLAQVLASLYDERALAEANAQREAKRKALEADEDTEDDEDDTDPSKPNGNGE